MGARGSSSVTQRATRAGRSTVKDKAGSGIQPLYKRLPHGPHRLERNEVILHQRTRIHGAMIEAVAEGGYEGTSVKQVIGLAGVSRRSFYEQFGNKEAGFLATFDVIAHQGLQRMRRAYLETDGDMRARLRSAFATLAAAATEDRKSALLVLTAAQTAGAAGTLRLCRAMTSCEQMLSACFAESPEATALPVPVVRGMVGGLHGALAALVREGTLSDADELAEQMLDWALRFQAPAAADLAERMAPELTRRMREISMANAHGETAPDAVSEDPRERLLQNMLRLAALHEYRELTAPQIADESGLTIDEFFEHFAGKDECYVAALDMVGDELLAIAANPELTSPEWPRAVRRTVGELMCHLAARPLYARTIGQEAFFAGQVAVQRNLEMARDLAALLSEGAPSQPSNPLTAEGVAGVIWHTIRCQVASGRIQLLGALSDYVSYLVLAPFIGAEAATEIVAEDLRG
jgi:TetR/AcrR family transcriptional regulator